MYKFVILLFLNLASVCTFAQSVIVNEMSQGNGGDKEWVELLVVGDNVNLQGWELGELDDDDIPDWNSIVTFTNISEWQSVKSGTLIVIYNQNEVDDVITSSGSDDVDFSDYNVTIASTNPYFFSGSGFAGAQFGNNDKDDCAAIRDASDVVIHDMAVTHGVATIPSPDEDETKMYIGDNVFDVVINSKWKKENALIGTPGQSNGGLNTIWVNALRNKPIAAVPVSPYYILLSLLLIVLYKSKKLKNKQFRNLTT